ncbi:phosphoribosylaminoimidazolesuccinocarboxamide synthase [Halobacteriales archaeon SW_7_71_33]|nr:MAG: phosphoribosylaminoimidazolesuccinocarboxamide synthase [Halobacteriales archaeon SW_7_71_33]
MPTRTEGSVKGVVVDSGPTGGDPGRGRFRFSDRYSVFDWGPMPDVVPGKGASLCTTGAHTFETLEARDVPTHYRGVRDPATGAVGPPEACAEPPTEMAVDVGRVPDLPETGDCDCDYDYAAYHRAGGDCFVVPLEVVFRNRVPPGSSLRRRFSPREHGLDRETWPDGVVDLPRPVVEFSTKYEPSDRYLDRAAAERVAGPADLDDLERLARAANDAVTDLAAAAGLRHEDGKLECLYVDGDLRVADVTGTLDENRFSVDGAPVSKELLREHHRRAQPEWVDAVKRAKADHDDWREHAPDPEPLDPTVVATVADAYGAFADAYADGDRFDAPALPAAVDAVADLV